MVERNRSFGADRAWSGDVATRADLFVKALVEAWGCLSTEPDLDVALRNVVGILGELAVLDRISIFRCERLGSERWCRLITEWCRPPLLPLAQVWPNEARVLESTMPEIFSVLRAGAIWKSVQGERVGTNADLNAASESVSDMIVPVMESGSLWGCVAFDIVGSDRAFLPIEVEVLRGIAEAIASAVRKKVLEDLLRTVAEVSRQLGLETDLYKGLARAVAILGEMTGFDRVYLLRREWLNQENCLSHLALHAKPGVCTVDERWVVLKEADYPEVIEVLLRGEAWQSVQENRKGKNQELNASLGTQSDVIVPIFVNREFWGAIGFDDCHSGRRFQPAEIDALRGVAAAIAGAVQRSGLEQEKTEAIARERERLAQQRADEFSKANEALQRVTDELASARGSDEIVPTVLRIAAQTFGSHLAGFFAVQPDGLVTLRYWLTGKRVLSPNELLSLSPVGEDAVPRMLAEGFRAPAEYLGGQDPYYRVDAVLVDHAAGTCAPHFDAWTTGLGAGLELNVPCVVGECAPCALTLYRRSDWHFTDAEIALAEALAKQLALAMQADRVSIESREAAVARERELAAEQRAMEFARANEVLRRTTDRLGSSGNLTSFLEMILQEASMQLGANAAMMSRYDGELDCLQVLAFCVQGEAEGNLNGLRGEALEFHESLKKEATRLFELQREAAWYWSGAIELNRRKGSAEILALLLTIDGKPAGQIGLAFRQKSQHPLERVELVKVLAQQASLAIQLDQLARQAKELALLEERTHLARELHDTLAQGFAAICMQLQAASREESFPRTPGSVRQYLTTAFEISASNLAEARKSIRSLRPAGLHRRPFGELLRQTMTDLKRSARCPIESMLANDWPPLPPNVEDELLRIAQEAVTNAIKHACAKLIQVQCMALGVVGAKIEVIDDGLGFEPANQTSEGFGISGMHERARRIGGTVTVIGEKGRGTQVIVVWTPKAGVQ